MGDRRDHSLHCIQIATSMDAIKEGVAMQPPEGVIRKAPRNDRSKAALRPNRRTRLKHQPAWHLQGPAPAQTSPLSRFWHVHLQSTASGKTVQVRCVGIKAPVSVRMQLITITLSQPLL